MTAYLIRSGVCMVLLFGLYHLILRKEKLFSFNRFYLIFAVVFPLLFLSFRYRLKLEPDRQRLK